MSLLHNRISCCISRPAFDLKQPHPRLFCVFYVKREITLAYMSVEKVFGILVLLGYDITACTPAAYLRSRLLRPFMEISS